LLSNEHLREVGLFEEYDHPSEGRMRQVRQPVTATGVERQADAPAPMVGQHSSEVLRDFGISDAGIVSLLESKVIAGAQRWRVKHMQAQFLWHQRRQQVSTHRAICPSFARAPTGAR
jgi:hypothetical protein